MKPKGWDKPLTNSSSKIDRPLPSAKAQFKPLLFVTKVAAFEEFSGMHYLKISKAQVKLLGGKFFVRLVCTLNKKVKFQCGLMGLGGGPGYVGLTQARMRTLGIKKGSKVQVKLEQDLSKYGLEMCEEMEESLQLDAEGLRRFEKLSGGKQRNILHYVSAVKNSDKRIDRALTIIENLKNIPEGKETVQALFQSSGKFNRQS